MMLMQCLKQCHAFVLQLQYIKSIINPLSFTQWKINDIALWENMGSSKGLLA
jgi:hypothetical protein